MELVNRVRQEDDLAITKIIAMSGKMTDAQLTGLKNTGFETYLKKPFQIRQVIQAVEQCMSVVY